MTPTSPPRLVQPVDLPLEDDGVPARVRITLLPRVLAAAAGPNCSSKPSGIQRSKGRPRRSSARMRRAIARARSFASFHSSGWPTW